MDYAHQTAPFGEERRRAARIDAILRFNYQVISESESELDPYNYAFMLPRYFQQLAELKQIDIVLAWELDNIKTEHPNLGHILELLNQKIDLINVSTYDALQAFLPSPEKLNISPDGLSFQTSTPVLENSYIHITLSHPDNLFHIAVTAHVVYCLKESNDHYRVGVCFVNILDNDRIKLSECIQTQIK